MATANDILERCGQEKLSTVNGVINRMKKDDIRGHLKLLGLDDR